MAQKGFVPILILIAVLLIAGVGGGAFYFGRLTAPKPSPIPQVASSTPQPTSSPVVDETVNWKSYENKQRGFKLNLPSNMNAWPTKTADGIGGIGIIFDDSMGAPGFESIFVYDYTKDEFNKTEFVKLLPMKIGERKLICESPSQETCTYTRLEDFIGQETFLVFQNDHEWEGSGPGVRMVAEKNGRYYTVFYEFSTYDDKQQGNGRLSRKLFEDIIRTFEFLQ